MLGAGGHDQRAGGVEPSRFLLSAGDERRNLSFAAGGADLRSGQVLGVLVIQNRMPKEIFRRGRRGHAGDRNGRRGNLVSGAVAGTGAAIEVSLSQPMAIEGEPLSEGIALGHIVLHEPRIVVTQLMADNPVVELGRLDSAL